MNRTLVTGGSGLVGTQFNGDNYIKISSKDYDLRIQKDVDYLFEIMTSSSRFNNHKPIDSVIHCAGKVGGVANNMNHKGEFFYDNIMINTNIIEACRKYNIKKLVCFLSTCIFPDNIEYPLTEKKIHLSEPHFSNDAYAYAKRMADIQIRAYNEQYGLNYTSIIPSNIYGINDYFNIENGHVIPSLIHKCYLAKQKNTDFEIWGNGEALREFIYSKDVAKLTEWVLNNYNDKESLILSNSTETSIKDISYIIAKEMEFKGDITFNTTKPNGQHRKPSDNSKLMSLLPDFKFTPIELGIKETIKWFKENYPSIRK
mgnify:CR=1 FL=1